MKELFKDLGVEIKSEFLEEAYKKAVSSDDIPYWLTKDFIINYNEKWEILPTHLDDVLEALGQVVSNKELVMLAKILYYIIELSPDRFKAFDNLKLPLREGKREDVLGYNFISEFPLLAHTEKACESLRKRGIDDNIIKQTYKYVDSAIDESSARMHFFCMNEVYFTWGLIFVFEEMLRIERFEFEIEANFVHPVRVFENESGERVIFADGVKIHREGYILGAAGYKDEDGAFEGELLETDEFFEGYAVNGKTHLFENKLTRLYKKDWKTILKKGDAAIGIHIPAALPLNDEVCVHSFDVARKVLKSAYPEYDFKAFETSTWLLAPELTYLLKPQSNILAFQKYFTIYPYSNSYAKAVFSFVYGMNVNGDIDVDYDKLSEDTSLMRSIKKQYQDGKYVHEFSGYFPF